MITRSAWALGENPRGILPPFRLSQLPPQRSSQLSLMRLGVPCSLNTSCWHAASPHHLSPHHLITSGTTSGFRIHADADSNSD